MAQRPAWTIRNNMISCESFDFEWNGGFSLVQKQKNVKNLHNSICNKYRGKCLEVSTKSTTKLGQEASAFNLKYNGYHVENIFQSSKIYSKGGPYKDLLLVSPREAKRDIRHKNSGKLEGFILDGVDWRLNPKTAFYDYLYIRALIDKIDISLLQIYDWFTDIEFNPKKSINCQARSITIAKYLYINNNLSVLDNVEEWIEFHKKHVLD